MTAKSTYAVRCADYTRGGFTTRESAERALASIEKAAACRLPHQVVAVHVPGGENCECPGCVASYLADRDYTAKTGGP